MTNNKEIISEFEINILSKIGKVKFFLNDDQLLKIKG